MVLRRLGLGFSLAADILIVVLSKTYCTFSDQRYYRSCIYASYLQCIVTESLPHSTVILQSMYPYQSTYNLSQSMYPYQSTDNLSQSVYPYQSMDNLYQSVYPYQSTDNLSQSMYPYQSTDNLSQSMYPYQSTDNSDLSPVPIYRLRKDG